uniref:Uncharacterized protein n=1 Tax=Candidatus Methanogaster sp. ANME-2c ERB4 TaxID=2759911 RepID=A0A7G9Y3F0_9EURY|nr:hypothetical protein MMHALIEK_00009 [Methanosarcinales archaeon ANME-2c ERB4]
MNNHNPHNHNEPLYGEHLFEGLIERALLHREDESIDTAQHQSSTTPAYRITIEHGSIRIRQECAASAGV